MGQTSTQGNTLLFSGSGSGEGIDFTGDDLTGSLSSDNVQSGSNGDASNGPFGTASYQAQDPYSADLAGLNFGAYSGLPNDFVVGSLVNSIGFRPQVPSGGFGRGMHSDGAGAAPEQHTSSEASGRGVNEDFRPRGRFGAGQAGVTASIRVNLGNLNSQTQEKPVITAVGVDPETHEIWAGIGDTVVHFSNTGEPMQIYNLTMKGGTPLKPTAILVEPTRLLIAADPWGIFEFDRPDKSAPAAPVQLNAEPRNGSPQR